MLKNIKRDIKNKLIFIIQLIKKMLNISNLVFTNMIMSLAMKIRDRAK